MIPIGKSGRAAKIVAILAFGLFLPARAAFSVLSLELQSEAQPAVVHHATDAQLARMNSGQLANYVFKHHGCINCHMMGHDSRLGLTDRGEAIGKNFEGCVSLLTSMNVIAQTPKSDRSAHDKQEAAHFQQFGCTTCHQIVPGKLGLSAYGKRMKSLHMACTDVQKILSTN